MAAFSACPTAGQSRALPSASPSPSSPSAPSAEPWKHPRPLRATIPGESAGRRGPRRSAFCVALASAAPATAKLEGSAAYNDVSTGNGSVAAPDSDKFFRGTETVSAVMTAMVVVATPDTLLGDILEHFAYYTGLPVVEERTHHLVGMITNIDMYKKQRGKAANVANTLVKEVMTSPVVAVYPHTLVSYAAGLMLKYKVHRLPVVDRELRVVGIVTNEDLFQTLTNSKRPAIESFRMVP